MEGRTVGIALQLLDWKLVKCVVGHAAAAGRNKGHVVAVVDVRRAYFYAEPLPKTFVELPDYGQDAAED